MTDFRDKEENSQASLFLYRQNVECAIRNRLYRTQECDFSYLCFFKEESSGRITFLNSSGLFFSVCCSHIILSILRNNL